MAYFRASQIISLHQGYFVEFPPRSKGYDANIQMNVYTKQK